MSDMKIREEHEVGKPPKNKVSGILTMSDIDVDATQKAKSFKKYVRNLYNEQGTKRENNKLFEKLHKDIWKGRRVFIVGGGPSLKGFDFNKLKGEIVITVNRTFEDVPWSVLNVSQDARVWGMYEGDKFGKESTKKWREYKGYKVFVNVQPFPFPEDIYTIDLLHPDDFNWDKFELSGGIPVYGNSGLNALTLACCFNPAKIYLLGFDMTGENGKTANYHSGYGDIKNESVYNSMVEDFKDVAWRIGDKRKIYNCNPQSVIKSFAQANLQNLKKPKKPLYVSFYTKDTGYQDEAKRLEQSLRNFGLEYSFKETENFGSWRANIHNRIQVLREFLDESKQDIVYIDADGAVCKYPELFESFKMDFGLVEIDRSKFYSNWQSKFEEKMEVLGGTMYLKNNKRVRSLLDTWERLDKPMETPLSQHTLIKALRIEREKGLRVKFLPLNYCQIFDTMADAGEPVVEHYQASRRSMLHKKARS